MTFWRMIAFAKLILVSNLMTTKDVMPVSIKMHESIAVVQIDHPPVNALSHAVRAGLLQAVETVNATPEIAAAVLVCAGHTFIAGADVREFNQPAREPHLPDVINAIEACSKPWVAAMHGNALGGGLEVALGCHYRIALSSARMGLPEVTLGLIPGAGGTVRLPRLIPVPQAVEMITGGKPISAKEAASLGLVEQIVDDDLEGAAVAFAKARTSQPLVSTRERSIKEAPIEPDFWSHAKSRLERKARGQMSPLHALEAVKNAVTLTFEDAYAKERSCFLDLRQSDQASALRHAFFAERAVGRLDSLKDVQSRALDTAGVIGGGTMGAGIAVALLLAGIRVTLVERDKDSLKAGVSRVTSILEGSVKRGLLTPDRQRELIETLGQTTTYEDLANVDLAIEAVFESMPVKQEVFKRLDKVLKPGAILATNTSYLDVNAIARTTQRPADVIGLHFFSPAHIMKLLEIVEADATAPDVLATGFELARKLRKVGVRSGVCDGFIGNRILKVYRQNAERLLLEGGAPAQVDSAMRRFGMPMGPFEMQDLAGLDIAAAQRQAAREKGINVFAPVSDRLCEQQRFGQKCNAGWYRYEENSRTPLEDEKVLKLIREEATKHHVAHKAHDDTSIQQTILFPMINEACFILDEGIATRPLDIDMVEIHGYGFPRWRGGLMHYADTIGASTLLDALGADQVTEPAPLIKSLAKTGGTFADLN